MIEYLWLPENRCNYGCPYCSYTNESARAPLVAKQKGVTTEQWEAAWERAYERDGEGWVYVTGGGEPTLHAGFARLALSVSRRHKLSFDTNLSWSDENLAVFLSSADPRRVRLELSFHPSDVSLDEFIRKARLVASAGFMAQCRWVAYPEHFGELARYERAFAGAELLFTVTPFKGEWGGRKYPESYSPEQRAAILSVAKTDGAPLGQIAHLLNENVESPLGKLCRAGRDYACVMPDGKAYRCQQYGMRDWEALGDFLDPSFVLAKTELPCRSRDCGHEYRWLSPSNPEGAAVA
jgi:MoaA/NifB/PqqE/SkfB family radical SAM enzyme